MTKEERVTTTTSEVTCEYEPMPHRKEASCRNPQVVPLAPQPVDAGERRECGVCGLVHHWSLPADYCTKPRCTCSQLAIAVTEPPLANGHYAACALRCPAVLDAGEQWRVLETVTRSSVVNERGETVAIGCGRGAKQRRQNAAQIVRDHNSAAVSDSTRASEQTGGKVRTAE